MKNHKDQKDRPTPNHPRIRRLGRILVFVLLILLILRITLWLSLPWLLSQSAQRVGMRCQYEALTLSLTTGDMEVWHLELIPTDSNDPLVDMEYCRANVSILSLIAGHLIVDRVEVDGIDITVIRESDGTFRGLQDLLALVQAPQPPTSTAPSAPASSPPIPRLTLDPHLRLRALRLQHAQIHYQDQSVTPTVDTLLDVTFRLSNLGFPQHETRFQLTLASEPILNQLVMEGTAQSTSNSLTTDFRCKMRGLHAASLAGYLSPLGVSAASETIEAGFQGELALTTSTPSPADANTMSEAGKPRLDARVALTQIFLKADDRDVLGLNQFTMTANIPDQQTLNITTIDCVQGDMHVWLREQDKMELAGLRFGKPSAPSRERTASPQRTAPLAWSLNELNMQALSLHLHDVLAAPATDSTVTLDRFTIGDLGKDTAGRYTQARIQAQLSAPGIFRSAQLEGKADLISFEKYLDASFLIEGFAPTGLTAYLDPLGLESLHKDARVSGHMQADLTGPNPDSSFRIDTRITDLRVNDPNELFRLDRIVIDQLAINPLAQTFHIKAIDVSGQHFPVQRNRDKSYSVLGFTIRPTAPQASAPDTKAPAVALDANQAPSTVPTPSSITIERFSWQNNQIELIDRAASGDQATVIPITYGLDVNNVQWETSDPNALKPAAQVRFWCKAPGVAESLRLDGTITPAPPGIGFDLALAGRELNGQKLTPYLEPFGIEPLFVEAELKATLKGQITPNPDGLETSFVATEVLFSEPNRNWVQVQSIDVQDMAIRGPVVALGNVNIVDPILSLTRHANGALVTCGLRVLPQESEAKKLAIKPIAIPVQLNQLTLRSGQLLWQDHSVQPPVDLTLHCDASLNQFLSNRPGEPAQLTVQLVVPSLLQSLQISGQAAIRPHHLETHLKIQASGIDLTPLTPYFQGPLQPALTNGEFSASLQTTLETNNTTQQAELFLQDLVLKSQGQNTPLVRFDQATAKLAITDSNTLNLNEISVKGLETLAQKTEAGGLEMLGMTFAQQEPPAPPAVVQPPLPGDVNLPEGQKTSPSQRLSLTHLPTVMLKSLDLHIASLTYVDLCRPQAAPIVAQDIRLQNTAPSKLISHDLETVEPLQLNLSGTLTPLVDSFQFSTKLTPFAPEPAAMIDLDVRGIHGEGLTAICPELDTLIDGTGLKDGRLRTKLLAVMRLPRHTLLDFNSSQPFELTLQLTDLTLSDQNEPDLLAGLKEMHAELPVVNLGKKEIQIKRLEMLEPEYSIHKTAQGLRVMNLLIKLPDANTPQNTNDVTAQAVRPSESNTPGLDETPFDIRLDEFVASGLDFTFTDDTIDPPLAIPLTGMEVEVRGLSTQPGTKPIHLNAIVSAGKISLPIRKKNRAKPDLNSPPSPTHEEIRLFQEITVMGRITPGLQPTGWIKAGLSGLELRHLSAAAQPSGVTIEDGVLDASLDVRLKENGKARVKTRLILSDLKLDEPEDGPLVKQLKLPVPLDTAIFILRGSDGTIRLPLDFTVTEKGVSSSQISSAAMGSASTVIAKVIAGSPLRAVSGVTRLLGGGQDKEMAPPEETFLSYAGGALELSPGNQAELDTLVEQIQTDPHAQMTIQHQLGIADLYFAEKLVNPSQKESLDLLNQLKQRKQLLLTERTRSLVQIQAAYATSESTQILTLTGKLRSIGHQLGLIETALDSLLDSLRPGADHATRRRTREGALTIAQARLSTLHSTLAQKGLDDFERRVKILAPSFVRSDEYAEGRITISMVKTKVK